MQFRSHGLADFTQVMRVGGVANAKRGGFGFGEYLAGFDDACFNGQGLPVLRLQAALGALYGEMVPRQADYTGGCPGAILGAYGCADFTPVPILT